MISRPHLLTLTLIVAASLSTGCAYRHYLGLHGPSIRQHPDLHDGSIKQDGQCLACHGPEGNGDAPPTSHPQFHGCLKCHNDPS